MNLKRSVQVSNVCVAGCWSVEGTSVYPDMDWPTLRSALAVHGLTAEQYAWEDDTIDWARFDLVLVRSTWTSVDAPLAFLKWARDVAAVTILENSFELVSWNLDKAHLNDFASAGVPTVPTTWFSPADRRDLPPLPLVVKPSISAGGRDTALYATDREAAQAHVARLQDAGRTVMVQRYIEAVAEAGETKMVFIDGQFSHALNVGPLLVPDGGVMEKPWEKQVPVRLAVPTVDELAIARSAIGYVSDRFGTPLYGRVDTVEAAGEPLVLEVELIDPSLSLWASPSAASALAAAVHRRLQESRAPDRTVPTRPMNRKG